MWVIISTSLMVKLSTNSTTCKFSTVYERQCTGRTVQNCGREMTSSSSAITMLPPIHCTSFKTFWPNTKSHKCSRPSIPQTWLLAVLQTENAIKGIHALKTLKEIKNNMTNHLLVILKSDSEKCFQQWKGCWNKWVESKGA